jgi:hypothetical protein
LTAIYRAHAASPLGITIGAMRRLLGHPFVTPVLAAAFVMYLPGRGPTLTLMGDGGTTPTGWDQSEDPTLDSPALGAIALVIAALSALCALTYFYSVFAYVGAAIALPMGVLSRGVPRSRGLGTGAIARAAVACVFATAALVSNG